MNLEPYTRASSVKPLNEKSSPREGDPRYLVAAGAFPTCAKCGTLCRTLSDQTGALQVGRDANPLMPWRCRACSSVLCQRCVGPTCPACKADAGTDGLIPAVACEACNSGALILSNAVAGEVTYLSLGGVVVAPLGFCGSCRKACCFTCGHKAKGSCPLCGAKLSGLFVPGYEGGEAVIAGVLPNGAIVVAAPGTSAAAKVASQKGRAVAASEPPAKRSLFQRLFGRGH